MRFTPLYAALSAAAVVSAHQLVPRALLPSIDTCAFVNTDVFTLVGLPDLSGSGKLKVCLCVSTIRPYVQAMEATSIAAELVGEDVVVNALVNLVTSTGKKCNYPAHALPVCQQGSVCDFGCDDGYTKSTNGKNCVCPAPKIECNGACQTQACSSSVPQNPSKRDTTGPKIRSRMRILTDERCPRGHVLCGAGHSRRRNSAEWECIDTRSTLDSCGGCMFPFFLDERPATGTDCSSLPGVSGVQCNAGRCLVHRCKRGWSTDPSGSECIPDGGSFNSTF